MHSRESQASNARTTLHKSHKIDDSNKLGFYMLLKGRCDMIFEVTKIRKLERVDSSQEDNGDDPMIR